MSQFMQSIYNLITSWQPLTYMLVAVVVIFIGAMFVIPKKESKEAAKSNLPYVVIGTGLILLAIVIAKEITSAFAF